MHSDLTRILRDVGLSVTAQRLAVLRAVCAHPHATADEVAEIARADIGAISRQTAYDSLAVMVHEGVVRRIHPAASAARFEARVGDDHHHLICRECGRLVDVECAGADQRCLTAADDHGYRIDEVEVVFWGRCPTCRPSAPDTAEQNEMSPTAPTNRGAP